MRNYVKIEKKSLLYNYYKVAQSYTKSAKKRKNKRRNYAILSLLPGEHKKKVSENSETN